MTATWITDTSTGVSNSGHVRPDQHATPAYSNSNPTYIGFLVHR